MCGTSYFVNVADSFLGFLKVSHYFNFLCLINFSIIIKFHSYFHFSFIDVVHGVSIKLKTWFCFVVNNDYM